MAFGDNLLFMILIAGGFTLVLGIVLVLALQALRKNSREASYERQLRDLIEDDEFDGEPDSKLGIAHRWNRHWGKLFKEAGFSRYNDSDQKAGRAALVATIVIGLALSLVLRNPIFGLIGIAVIVGGSSAVMGYLGERKAAAISNQLPGFLFALKANIDANETPDKAILKVIDSMPSPLRDDLEIVRGHILTNSSFREAMLDLSEKTSSADLKFLCACILQASKSGAHLSKQIVVIQKVLEDRKKISDELNRASKTAATPVRVTSVVLPVLFIAVISIDPNSADFWFQTPLSWGIFAVIVLIYLAGVFTTRQMLRNIKNL